jgi:O-antigen ligase
MRDATYSMRWLVSPFVGLLVIALAGLFWLGTVRLEIPASICLILLVQLVLFCLAFRRPVWALAALMVGQLTESGYVLYPTAGFEISITLLWTVATVLLLIPIIAQKGLDIGDKARGVVIPAIILFGLATISNFVNTDISDTFRYLRWTITALAILLLLPTMVKEEKDLKLIGVIAIITCSISAIAAIAQHYFAANSLIWSRATGLTPTPIQLGLNMSILCVPVIGVFLLKGTSPLVRKLLALAAVVLFFGLIYSFTRSGIYALGLGILAMALLLKGRIRYRIIFVTLILGVAFFSYSYINHSRFSAGLTEVSAATRPVLWQAGVNVALDHPLLGIGEYRFEEVSSGYKSTVSSRFLENQQAAANLGRLQPHDDFILVWASFGTLALLAFVWLLVGIFQNFVYSYRHAQGRFLKSLALGCAAAVVVYVINAALHNIMDSVFTLWILGGLSIVLARLVLSESTREREKS